MDTMKTSLSLRSREDLASIALGAVAAVAPWFLPSAPDGSMIIINALIVGVVIAGLAALDRFVPPHWEEPFEVIAGVWLMVSPVWLGYGGLLGTLHAVIGALVVVLAALEFWQDQSATGS